MQSKVLGTKRSSNISTLKCNTSQQYISISFLSTPFYATCTLLRIYTLKTRDEIGRRKGKGCMDMVSLLQASNSLRIGSRNNGIIIPRWKLQLKSYTSTNFCSRSHVRDPLHELWLLPSTGMHHLPPPLLVRNPRVNRYTRPKMSRWRLELFQLGKKLKRSFCYTQTKLAYISYRIWDRIYGFFWVLYAIIHVNILHWRFLMPNTESS